MLAENNSHGTPSAACSKPYTVHAVGKTTLCLGSKDSRVSLGSEGSIRSLLGSDEYRIINNFII